MVADCSVEGCLARHSRSVAHGKEAHDQPTGHAGADGARDAWLPRRPQPGAARCGRGGRRAAPGARRRRHRQDPRSDHAPCPSAHDRPGAAVSGARGHLHQQGGARDDPARVAAARAQPRGAVARHLPCARRAPAAPPRRADRAEGQLHHPRYRRPAASVEAGDRGRGPRPAALDAARPAVDHRALQGPRPDAGQGARIGHRRLRARAHAPALCRLPGAPA